MKSFSEGDLVSLLRLKDRRQDGGCEHYSGKNQGANRMFAP